MEATVSERPMPTGEGLTFEKVWAMFQETDRKFKESDRKFEKMREETDRIIKETDRKIGYLDNRFGELAEHLVAPAVYKRFNDMGYHFDSVATRGCEVRDDRGKTLAEVDILLENGSYIMAVEVKAKPHIKDIEHHVKRLEILREHKRHDTRKIQGAIAGAIFGNAEKQAVIEAGFFVLEQSGDTVQMDVPDGFIPREW